MKRFYYLLLPILFAGCKPGSNTNLNHTVKPMPASESAFIKKITTTDSVFRSQKNEITKKEYLETGKKEMESYILKNLDVKDWVVKVSKIESHTDPVDYITLEVFVPIGDWREKKYPEQNFPIFKVLIDSKKEADLVKKIKALEDKDEVYVSGNIVKTLKGGINVAQSEIGINDDATFSNIGLDLHLTDIRKTH
jgi:hypothetical protein